MWEVELHPQLKAEVAAMAASVRVELLSHTRLLREFGPTLGRPAVDTLKGSAVANLKELRFRADGGVWRVLFAFDGNRVAVLLTAADKRGQDQKRFYNTLIALAERRWSEWGS